RRGPKHPCGAGLIDSLRHRIPFDALDHDGVETHVRSPEPAFGPLGLRFPVRAHYKSRADDLEAARADRPGLVADRAVDQGHAYYGARAPAGDHRHFDPAAPSGLGWRLDPDRRLLVHPLDGGDQL